MRIGVDACCWSNKRGYGRFTRELLKALIEVDQKNDYWFFVDEATASLNKFPEKVKVIVAPTRVTPTEAASSSGHRSLRDLWVMTRKVMKHDLDLFFFPTVYSYFPIMNQSKIVMTIHDMIPEQYPDEVFNSRKQRLFWKIKQYLAILQSHVICTVSEHSKQQIIKYCNMPESRIHVISEAPSTIFKVLPRDKQMEKVLRHYRLDLRERFLLHVGGISPHKNLRALIDVFHSLTINPMFSDVKLILVGDYQSDSFLSNYPALKQQLKQLRLDKKVVFTGFIDDVELAYLYNAATLLVFPSLQEGFGLPAIEAMACGTPVAASAVGSLPEVLGEAGRLFDPHNSAEMLEVIKNILSNDGLRQQMSHLGLIRVKQYDWDKAAKETLTVFNEIMCH